MKSELTKMKKLEHWKQTISHYNKHIENFQKLLCTKQQSKYVLPFLKNMFNNAKCDVLISEPKFENHGKFTCKIHIISKENENEEDDDEARLTASLVLYLNDDFEGGDLMVKHEKAVMNKGDATLFTPQCLHWVTGILAGHRYVLAVWGVE